MFFVRTAARTSFAKPALLLSGASLAITTCYYSFLLHRAGPSPLSPSCFTPTTLIESVDVSPDSKLLTLSVSPDLLPRDSTAFAPIWSVFVKDTDIQVERPYTPLDGMDKRGHIKLWVKKYEDGQVSRWLHSRKVGDSVEIRGPVPTWSTLWQDGHWDEVVLISGGTGITPFYQLLQNVFGSDDTSVAVHFTLLHGSRSLEDLPPPNMSQFLVSLSQKHPDTFKLHLFADSANRNSEQDFPNLQKGRINKSVLQHILQPTHSIPWWRRLFGSSNPALFAQERKILVLVCGPEGMVNAIAGPYGRNYSQGRVGGMLGELGLQSHQVWKL